MHSVVHPRELILESFIVLQYCSSLARFDSNCIGKVNDMPWPNKPFGGILEDLKTKFENTFSTSILL
jgi:hypothetical protein